MNEIPDLLKNNSTYLKACILYEVLHKKPVFESYQNICEKIGDDTMSYIDCEYWYYRFYNGELDFNCNRTHTQKTFLQLPPEMCDLILKELSCREREEKHEKNVEGNFMEIGLKAISSYIKFRNIRSKLLVIRLRENAPDITNALTQFFPYSFFSKEISIFGILSTNYLAILERLEPGYLEVILLFFESDENKNKIDNSRIFEMPQFQQAKFVYFSGCDAFRFADLTHFYRFQGFSVVLDNLTVEEAIVLRDTLAGLPHFEGCNIYLDNVDLKFLMDS